ncbi:MAG TPA: DNA-3-methyladenine glycosylase [Candidatus Paceibacterota bacterium]
MKKLGRKFFMQPSLTVAKQLLGKIIVRKVGQRLIAGKIVETEAYPGPYDKASHAFQMKRTKRNEAEYREGGYIYIYLVYGMYWQLNISTGKEGYPECVLIRALEPISNLSAKGGSASGGKNQISNLKTTNGPGKLCKWLKLDKSFYGEDVTKSKRIWITNPDPKQVLARGKVASGPRIGIDYAGPKWAKKPWRFWIKNSGFVSAK